MKLCKKVCLCFLAAAAMLLCLAAFPQTAHAADESDLTFNLKSDGNSYSVSKCDTAATGELVIPASYNGLPVTSIASYAFNRCNQLTGVTIPDTVTEIGREAFYGCSSLVYVTIPEGVTKIDSYAFIGCKALSSVTIPSTVTKIGTNPFTYSNSLTSLKVASGNSVYHSAGNCIIETATQTLIVGCPASKIPSDGSVTVIGKSAFENCDALTAITIPKGITVIDSGAFWDCDVLTNISIPNSVVTIGEEAFYHCPKLTGITFPASVDSIGKEAFAYCNSLISLKVAANNPVYHSGGDCIIETASKTLIAGCSASKIPADGSVVIIGDSAFSFCQSLTDITIPNTVTTIKEWAFYSCKGLTSITIPDSITTIEKYAFDYCSNLTSITFGKGVTTIGESAFSSIYKLTELAIPDGITDISKNAFSYCNNLTTVRIPGSVTSIGKWAFSGCNKLSTVVFCGTQEQWSSIVLAENNEPLTNAALQFHSMKNGVCTYCAGITDADCDHSWEAATCEKPKTCTLCQETEGSALGHNMQQILDAIAPTCETAGRTAAYSCTNDCGKLEGGEEVPAIGHNYVDGICANCGQKDNSVLSFMLNENGSGYILAKCDTSATGELVIPATYMGLPVSYIDDFAFSYCESLTSVIIPSGVTGIGNNAFEYCSSLTNISIPNTVLIIGDEAFNFCTKLSGITLPDSLLFINTGAFWSCESLKEITIPKNVISIQDSVFGYCDSLTSIKVAEGNSVYHSAGNCIIKTDTKTLIAGCNNSKIPTDGSVTNFGYYAMIGCQEMTSFTLPSVITSITGNPLTYCDNLTTLKVEKGNSVYHSAGNCIIETATKTLVAGCNNSKIPTDGSVTSLGLGAFENCNYLTEITIPSTVTNIGPGAFWDCERLTEITIPGSVTDIDEYAFANCAALTTINIPTGITAIKEGVFDSCSALAKVIYCGTQEQWASIEVSAYNYALNRVTVQFHKYKNGVCTICSAVDCGSKGHSMKETVAGVTATCEIAGKMAVLTCANCGKTEGGEIIPALGHNMQETAAAVAPTCEKPGKTAASACANCGKTEGGNEIPATGHSMQEFAAVEPTCTASGKTAAYTCANCGKTEGGKVVPAKGHSFAGDTCTVCGQGKFVVGDANGDGKVNLKDAILALQAANGKDAAVDRSAADVNADGKVNLKDAILILKRANGNKDPFPAEK